MQQKKAKAKRRKKILKKVSNGVVYVHATFNNTIITISDEKGEVLCWSSAGTSGFKGSRKSTPFAANIAAREAAKKAKTFGIRDISVYVKGPGSGKESVVKSLKTEGLNVGKVVDRTPTPHNGCRQKKRRRI